MIWHVRFVSVRLGKIAQRAYRIMEDRRILLVRRERFAQEAAGIEGRVRNGFFHLAAQLLNGHRLAAQRIMRLIVLM